MQSYYTEMNILVDIKVHGWMYKLEIEEAPRCSPGVPLIRLVDIVRTRTIYTNTLAGVFCGDKT